MTKVIKVSFNENGGAYYFKANDNKLCNGLSVLVETEQGIQFGQTVSDVVEIDAQILNSPLKDVIRIATKKDRQNYQKNKEDAKIALKVCKELAEKYDVKIFPIDASYTFDRDQLIFHFVADSRVDFRELAKALASKYRTRIELRQVGVRDKAKKVGGLGSCGQELCCYRFLKEFESVSISMAKNQNIALNPTKINGSCGRLLCCLKYENETYSENKKVLPKIGTKKKISEGEGTVVSIDVLEGTYTVDIPKVGQVTKRQNNGND